MTHLSDLLLNPLKPRHYLVILHPYSDVASAVTPLYYSTQGFITEPYEATDVPANQYFDPRIQDPLNLERFLFGPNGEIGGALVPNYGTITFLNGDGHFDSMSTFGWDDRHVEVLMGGDGFEYDDYETIMTGYVEAVSITETQFVVRTRCVRYALDVPILTDTFAGTGSDEGDAAVLGQYHPLTYGRVRNIAPPVISLGFGDHQAHNGSVEDIDAVYAGTKVLSEVTASPTTDEYVVDVITGRVIVGGAPLLQQITTDVKGARVGGSYLVTIADIVSELITSVSNLTAADLDTSSFTTFNSSQGATVGMFVHAQKPLLDVISELVNSGGGFLMATRLGKLKLARFEAPGTSELALTDVEITRIERIPTVPPVWKVILGYQPNWTVQVEFQAQTGSTVEQRDFVAREFRKTQDSDSSVLVAHPRARTMEINTLFDDSAVAAAEATRVLNLYKVDREMFRVTAKSQPFTIDLNATVTVTYSRYGLSAGKDFRVVGLTEIAGRTEVVLTLWG